ncbi:unnamed protein product [Camellia sinensis]
MQEGRLDLYQTYNREFSLFIFNCSTMNYPSSVPFLYFLNQDFLGWFLYYFCSGENVCLLCKKHYTSGVANVEGSDLFVVLISNKKKQVIDCLLI